MHQVPARPFAHHLSQLVLALSMGATLCSPALGARSQEQIDTIVVNGQRYLPDYNVRQTRGATKIDARLLDVPQAITVVTDKLVADQAMTSMSDVFRYMPGIGVAQGEGNRDTPVLRGTSSTADFYVDGIRDDVQYYRDVYNLERVEALKGPNAMIFGRGGSGGVINRITRQADGENHRNATLQFGSDARRRATMDVGTGIGETAGVRLDAMYEKSDSFRDHFELERYGVNPSYGVDLGSSGRLQLSYEHFKDERTADRGIPSFLGRPVHTSRSTFFGNPRLSHTDATVDAIDVAIDYSFSENLSLRNHLRWADYDKFYQNVFPGTVNASGTQVNLAAYSNATERTSTFNQSDLVWKTATGTLQHTVLLGMELGRQSTDNFRRTGYFAPGTNVVALGNPTVNVPIDFRQSATDADNHIVAETVAVYVQDLIEFSPQWQAIVGLRYDDFRVDMRNNRNRQSFDSSDELGSPRAGLIYKPRDDVSFYASYSVAYQPRAGEQLSSLTTGNASLRPESYRNREIGAKWDISQELQASAAVYRLDRKDVAVVDPNDVTRTLLVDGENTEGVELGLAGRITDQWQLMGGYAYQDGELDSALSTSAAKGNRLAQLPRHSFSLWNRYDFSPSLGAGIGLIHRGEIYANVDNLVSLPSFTRLDAAVYWTPVKWMQVQLNVENLTDRRYFASAHSNNNIMPGAPRSAWLSFNFQY